MLPTPNPLPMRAMREPGLEPGCREAADPKSDSRRGTHYKEGAPTRTEARPNRTENVTARVTRAIAALGSLLLRVVTESGLRGWA
jgi:hypothetical protein